MCTKEAEIHDKVKQKIVDSDERDTVHIFRTLRNTARVFKNKVSMEIVKIENRPGGAEFKDIQHLASGARGKTVYTSGDIDAGVWSAGITVGLIHDIVSVQESRSSLSPALSKKKVAYLSFLSRLFVFSKSLHAKSLSQTLNVMQRLTSREWQAS